MRSRYLDLRGVVLAWTILTTTFAWTPTMRLLLKPEISHWSIFGLGGSGGSGPFWVLPVVAGFALLLFYVEGRGRLRPLFHGLLLIWHIPLAATVIYWSLQRGTEAEFMGAAWGVTIPFPLLAVPFAFFAFLALVLVVRESRGALPVPVSPWGQVHWGKVAVAGLLLPVAAVFFRLGDGFDIMVKIAIAATVLQWILLAEALGRQQNAPAKMADPGPVAS
jgi:hypothetical protein